LYQHAKAAKIALVKHPTEATYPIKFRSEDAKKLGQYLSQNESVVLVGMKRVGISNFLRFFLYQKSVAQQYLKSKKHIFIPVDLNDLVERKIYPFWILVLKRIVDVVEKAKLPQEVKTESRKMFSECIQLKDLFCAVDSVFKVVNLIVSGGYFPVLFIIRFDRLRNVFTQEFFANLQGLKDASQRKLSYVFTSFRPLNELAPNIFTKSSLSVFSRDQYLKPAKEADMKTILKTFQKRYKPTIKPALTNEIIHLAGGHVQYLHLALIKLLEEGKTNLPPKHLLNYLTSDEQIRLQSEELFERLTEKEKRLLLRIIKGSRVTKAQKDEVSYLFNTGIITENRGQVEIFSSLYKKYLQDRSKRSVDPFEFTKKEHLLYSFLAKNEGELCERDDIIHAAWPEQEELGISDWALDRLVARVRLKLKKRKSTYKITTIVTRGYKLESILKSSG
jgi:DNA-binding winged helix-turn-helix (wHTH) protein